MKNFKRTFSAILILVVALVLIACKKPTEGTDGEIIDFSDRYSQKSVIRVWIDDENGEYMQEIIEEFQRLNPGIIVEHQHKGSVDAREHLKTFGPSGHGADVFQFPHDHLAQAILEDLVLPLPNETANKIKETSHELGIDIATLSYNEDAGTFDPNDPNATERLYAVPMSLEAVGLYYNTDLVEGDPATSYEQIIEEAKVWNAALSEQEDKEGSTNAEAGHFYLGTSSHWADSYFIQHIYSAFGWNPFGPNLDDATAVGFEDENLQDALTWMRDELKPITTGTGTANSIGAGENFENGLIPYIIAGPWNIEGYRAKGVNFKVAKLPTINDQVTAPYAGAMMAAVYKYSKNQADAIKFVEFLSTETAMEIQFRHKFKLPALKSELLENIPGVLQDQAMVAMSEELENAKPMPTIPQVTYYWGPGETMVNNVWNGTMTVLEAVKEAEQSYRVQSGMGSGE